MGTREEITEKDEAVPEREGKRERAMEITRRTHRKSHSSWGQGGGKSSGGCMRGGQTSKEELLV